MIDWGYIQNFPDLPTNLTFQTLWGRKSASGVRRDIFATIWPNTDFMPSAPARPPRDRERFTLMRFSSTMGPCWRSLTMVAWITCWYNCMLQLRMKTGVLWWCNNLINYKYDILLAAQFILIPSITSINMYRGSKKKLTSFFTTFLFWYTSMSCASAAFVVLSDMCVVNMYQAHVWTCFASHNTAIMYASKFIFTLRCS